MTLAAAIAACRERALAGGALEPIETEQTRIEDGGVAFVVRRVSSLARKLRASGARGEPKASEVHRAGAPSPLDPFDPPDPALVVGDLSASHVAVLNKFPVLDAHLLLVTRRFVDQERLLDGDDLDALARVLGEIDGLGFYNAGAGAGASQPHKHLQLVPLPLVAGETRLPVEALFDAGAGGEGAAALARVPFQHAFLRLPPGAHASGARLLDAYFALLAAAGLHVREGRASAPYNLLATRRWMLLVPRVRERCGAISVNALGFAGSLFARDEAELAALRGMGPMAVLRAVAVPRGAH